MLLRFILLAETRLTEPHTEGNRATDNAVDPTADRRVVFLAMPASNGGSTVVSFKYRWKSFNMASRANSISTIDLLPTGVLFPLPYSTMADNTITARGFRYIWPIP